MMLILMATLAVGCHKDYTNEPDLRDYADLERVQTSSTMPSHDTAQ